jgi:hypothetical protein
VRQLLGITLFFSLALLSEAADKKPPVGPISEGAIFEGTFKSGSPLKNGKGIDPKSILTQEFRLVIDSIDGEDFVGQWTWNETKAVTQVEGTINKKGQFKLKYTKDLVGKSPTVLEAAGSGIIGVKGIEGQYIRPTANRIGAFTARAKEGQSGPKEGKKDKKEGQSGPKEDKKDK